MSPRPWSLLIFLLGFLALEKTAEIVFSPAGYFSATGAPRRPAPLPSASPSPVAELQDFEEEIERDFPLRSIGQLQITNMRGDIAVQGWSLDKVRVKARKRARSDSPQEAKRLLAAQDFRYSANGRDIELSAEYGKGLTLEERLKERSNPRTEMEMVVFAPAGLRLRIWGVRGKAVLQQWSGSVEMRTASGPITVESVKADNVSLLCPACDMKISSVRGSLRAMGGSGKITLSNVHGPNIYVESDAGEVRGERLEGEQLFVSKSGQISLKSTEGSIEFHAEQASVDIEDAAGFLSGKTSSGDITAKMREWKFVDKALLESASGAITLTLPRDFSGDVDLWSLKGRSECAFSVQRIADARSMGPEPLNRVVGRVRHGGEQLKIFSEKGNVKLLKAHE